MMALAMQNEDISYFTDTDGSTPLMNAANIQSDSTVYEILKGSSTCSDFFLTLEDTKLLIKFPSSFANKALDSLF